MYCGPARSFILIINFANYRKSWTIIIIIIIIIIYYSAGEPDYDHDGWQKLPPGQSVRVAVVRKQRVLDHIFTGVISVFVLLANIGMGCKIDLDVVKAVLKKPFAPAIGFGCQFIFMPLVCMGFT